MSSAAAMVPRLLLGSLVPITVGDLADALPPRSLAGKVWVEPAAQRRLTQACGRGCGARLYVL